MNIQVDPTSSNLAFAMLNSKIRPRAVVGYGVKIFDPSPPNYVTRSPGMAQHGEDENGRNFKTLVYAFKFRRDLYQQSPKYPYGYLFLAKFVSLFGL